MLQGPLTSLRATRVFSKGKLICQSKTKRNKMMPYLVCNTAMLISIIIRENILLYYNYFI